MEVLVKRMTDTKDGRGERKDKEWHRERGDTGESVGERNDRHKRGEGDKREDRGVVHVLREREEL